MLLGSANTDEQVYDHSKIVDFDRRVIRHLGFGAGPHRCLGSHLAHLKLRVSLREWHERIPSYHVRPDVEPDFERINRQAELTSSRREWRRRPCLLARCRRPCRPRSAIADLGLS